MKKRSIIIGLAILIIVIIFILVSNDSVSLDYVETNGNVTQVKLTGSLFHAINIEVDKKTELDDKETNKEIKKYRISSHFSIRNAYAASIDIDTENIYVFILKDKTVEIRDGKIQN